MTSAARSGRRAEARANAWVARHRLSGSEYQAEFDKWHKQGYRLTDVSGYEWNGGPHYAAIWEQKAGPDWSARHGLTAAQYQTEFDKQLKAGFRPVLINGYTVGGTDYYAAIWEKGLTQFLARHGMTGAQYQAAFDQHQREGYRLTWISGYGTAGHDRYAAIWEKRSGPAWTAKHGLTSAQYQAEFDKQAASGFRLVHVGGYGLGGQERYVAIWEKSGGPPWLGRHGLGAANYQSAFDNQFYSGYRLVRVSGYSSLGGDRYAALWQNTTWGGADLEHIDSVARAFVKKFSVPGLSLAIAKEGRLVFAKGYGLADKLAGEETGPSHRFRIASVSKPFTSVAIRKLMQDLPASASFNDTRTVFGPGSLLGTAYGSQPYKKWVTDIQLTHLLHHTGGGWPNDGTDPMFSHPLMGQAQLISSTLDNLALANEPGKHYAYSNFGYSVLGRVIEKLSGKSYQAYVKEKVLAPIGITGMEIAGDTLLQRKPREVVYYDSNPLAPYAMQVGRMDSHGGWIATAIDLVRFGVRVDGFPSKPDILTPESITKMTAGSPANGGYACGWSVNPSNNWWHNGSLPGTFSILVRTSSGLVWAALINTRNNDPDLDGMMWQLVNGVKAWPGHDLF